MCDVYIARDNSTFVMYCVYGKSGSSLVIESTYSMMYNLYFFTVIIVNMKVTSLRNSPLC